MAPPRKLPGAVSRLRFFSVLGIFTLLGGSRSSHAIGAQEPSSAELDAFEAMLKGHHDPLPSTFEMVIKEMESWQEGEGNSGKPKRRRIQGVGPLKHWTEVRDEKMGLQMAAAQGSTAGAFPEPDDITWGVLMPGFEPANVSTGAQLRGERPEAVRRKLEGEPVKQLGMKPPKLNSGPSVAALNSSHYRWDSVVAPCWVDWRETAAATLVKDQRKCSSCWAIVVADAVSMMWQIRKGKGDDPLPKYKESTKRDPQFMKQGRLDGSAQQICDCMLGDCCQGGWPEWALSYVAANGGLSLWRDYPYYGQKTTCNYNQSQEIKIKTYQGGFYDGDCSNHLDHVVLIVGYGKDPKYGDYWIIKNTWGEIWGDEGYMYLKATDGKGKCGIGSVEALYPTYFRNEGEPCSYFPNPCGAGKCFKQKIGGVRVARCGCPPGTVENSQSYPAKCVKADPCSANPNPCGAGSCANLRDGSYECRCPEGMIVGAAASGAPTCVSGNKNGGVRTYMITEGDTCKTVTSSYKISIDLFVRLNGWVDCSDPNAPMTAGAVVAVGDDDAEVGCARSYVVQPTDTCQSIATTAGTTTKDIQTQNPMLNCDKPLSSGTEICLTPGGVTAKSDRPAVCAKSYEVRQGDSCATLKQAFKLSNEMFASLNPDVNCNQKLTVGMSICLALHAGDLNIKCSKWYRVQHGDKCPTIWLAASLTEAQFSYINPGVRCDFPHLQVGQLVCIEAPGNVPAFLATIPYTVQAGDTLNVIASKLTDRCGSDASPENIAIQNRIDRGLALLPGTLLQVPCSPRVSRTCGCTSGTWYCGADGVWYSSYCNVVCNGALPAASFCTSCKSACKSRAGLPPAWGGCTNPCPWPQWNPLPNNWNWFTNNVCTYYIKACQDWCTDSASTASIMQNNWSNWPKNYESCVAACRRGKC